VESKAASEDPAIGDLAHPLVRREWQLAVASSVQVLAGISNSLGCATLRIQAETALAQLSPPHNHGERMIAKAILLSVALHHLGIDDRALLVAFFGEPGLRLAAAAPEEWVGRSTITLAARARAIIDQDYARALTVQTLSAQLHAHRNVLAKQFKAVFGNSISDYIRLRRGMAAAELLRSGTYSHEDIARSIGCSVSTFYRRYRNVQRALIARGTDDSVANR
jgi:AraC-like DNA-binding protein